MKRLGRVCIECGSRVVSSIVDEVKPVFRMETIGFACGAELRTVYSANDNVGRVSQSGCTGGEL